MSIACHSFLIVKFLGLHGYIYLFHGSLGFHYVVLGWVITRVNSAIACLKPGCERRIGSRLFSFFVFLGVFSLCTWTVYWLCKCLGQLGMLTLHITSRKAKAQLSFTLFCPHIVSPISLRGMGYLFLPIFSDGFHYLVYLLT